jgi:hypothetical protein
VWKVLKGLDGRARRPLPDTPVSDGRVTVVDEYNKARISVAHYARVSRVRIGRTQSKAAYSTVRRAIRHKGGSAEQLSPFTRHELRLALRSGRGRAPGVDKISAHNWAEKKYRQGFFGK